MVWLGEDSGESGGCGDGWMGDEVWGLGRFVERERRDVGDGGGGSMAVVECLWGRTR